MAPLHRSTFPFLIALIIQMYRVFMYPGTIDAGLCRGIGIVAVSHVRVFWETINSLHVLVSSVHQGEAVITHRAHQAIDVTLKYTVGNYDQSSLRETGFRMKKQQLRREESSGCTFC